MRLFKQPTHSTKHCRGALTTALHSRGNPRPQGEYLVVPPVGTALKLAIYLALHEAKISRQVRH